MGAIEVFKSLAGSLIGSLLSRWFQWLLGDHYTKQRGPRERRGEVSDSGRSPWPNERPAFFARAEGERKIQWVSTALVNNLLIEDLLRHFDKVRAVDRQQCFVACTAVLVPQWAKHLSWHGLHAGSADVRSRNGRDGCAGKGCGVISNLQGGGG